MQWTNPLSGCISSSIPGAETQHDQHPDQRQHLAPSTKHQAFSPCPAAVAAACCSLAQCSVLDTCLYQSTTSLHRNYLLLPTPRRSLTRCHSNPTPAIGVPTQLFFAAVHLSAVSFRSLRLCLQSVVCSLQFTREIRSPIVLLDRDPGDQGACEAVGQEQSRLPTYV